MGHRNSAFSKKKHEKAACCRFPHIVAILYLARPCRVIVEAVKYNLLLEAADFRVPLAQPNAPIKYEYSVFLPASHTLHLHLVEHGMLNFPEIHAVAAAQRRAHPVVPYEMSGGYVSRCIDCGGYPSSLSSTLFAAKPPPPVKVDKIELNQQLRRGLGKRGLARHFACLPQSAQQTPAFGSAPCSINIKFFPGTEYAGRHSAVLGLNRRFLLGVVD